MCGIYGFAEMLNFNLYNLETGIKRIQHRGPNDVGYYVREGYGIGACRLSINEIDSGNQPYISPNKNVGVVFNGEIYNYKILSQQEELLEHTSEAELIAHMFMKYGVDFVHRIDGMYAIAIIDFEKNSLALIRDRFGKKPLWYLRTSNGSLEFASEIKAFQSAKTIRNEFVSEFLTFGYIPFNHSTYNEIRAVPPASYLILQNKNVSIKSYWNIEKIPKENISYKAAKSKLDKLFRNAVSKRLISERPIGAYLSGGYDSSIVSAAMAKITRKVKSYSVAFSDPIFDESTYSSQIAKQLDLEHKSTILEFNVEEIVREVFSKLDQPFADSSIVPTYLLSKFARKEIVVALGGDGGDEIFGGYARYVFAPFIFKYSRFLRWIPSRIPGKSTKIGKINRKLERLHQEKYKSKSFGYYYLNLMSLIKFDQLTNIIKSPISSQIAIYAESIDSATHLDVYRRMMYSDIQNYLVGDLLVKADLASMFNGIELRSPMLDCELAEFVSSLPTHFLISKFRGKRILKDLAHNYVPKKLLNRQKMGFGVPLASWLRVELISLMHNCLKSNKKSLELWLDMNLIENLLNKHLSGEDHSRTLWPVLCLALWIEYNLLPQAK